MASTRTNPLRRWLMMVVLFAAAVTAVWWGYVNLTRPQVVVTEAVIAPVVEAFYATGTLSPDREYPIRSNVEGTIIEVAVDKGTVVKRGQLLARVRDEQRELQYRQAQADFELRRSQAAEETSPVLAEFDARISSAQEQLDIAQREYERVAALREGNAAAQVDFDRSLDRLEVARALNGSLKAQRAARKLELQRDLAVAQAALDIAQWNLDQQTLTSPIDGVVLNRPISLGTRVKINDDLMRVGQVAPEQLVMRAAVDEEDRTQLHLEQRVLVTMYAYPGRVFEGKVSRVYPQADPQRRTFEVDVQVLQPESNFAAGMTGELAFIVAQRESALVVPAQAVNGNQVWLVNDSQVKPVQVQVGLRSIERTEIIGLEQGQRVVISPADQLHDGQLVRITYMDPAVAAGLNTPQQTDSNFRGFK